jgi:hypothetical protein
MRIGDFGIGVSARIILHGVRTEMAFAASQSGDQEPISSGDDATREMEGSLALQA